MTPQTTAGAVKPSWTTAEFWCPAKSAPALAHPQGGTGAAVQQLRSRCSDPNGYSPDAR
jgi:hypothetical protein